MSATKFYSSGERTDPPGAALFRASVHADNIQAEGTLGLVLKTEGGAYDVSCFTHGLTLSQAIALLEIEKARLLNIMIESDRPVTRQQHEDEHRNKQHPDSGPPETQD